MRVLAISKIFPNSLEPLSAPFNRQQFKALSSHCDLTVLAAIPYVPGAPLLHRPARAAKLSALPDEEVIDGISTRYLRQLYVPKIGIAVAMPLYLASLAPYRQWARQFDVILATWAYPDGCAAIAFAGQLKKPCVVKVHGSDINVVAKMTSARAILKRVLPMADATVAVSRPLAQALVTLGVDGAQIHLVPNGVDREVFGRMTQESARQKLSVGQPGRKIVLFCGRLEPQKGLEELLDAFEKVRRVSPQATLVLLGEGPMRERVDALSREWKGGQSAVMGEGHFEALIAPGARPLSEVATWMSACDVFTLPSWNEGTPNVVLEALASGRPVVGSRVGGIPDALANPETGIIVPPRDASALAEALVNALGRTWDEKIVRSAGPPSWSESGAKLFDVLSGVERQARLSSASQSLNHRPWP